MITCAITGHTGVLGSNFIKNNSDIKFIKFSKDLSKKNEIKKWIKENSFDYFLHLGAVVPTHEVKKNYNYAYALIKLLGKFLKAFFKIIFYSIIFKKNLKNKYLYRFLGLLNSILGRPSNFRG